MQARRLRPTVISFNAAISACGKGGRSERALALHDEMQSRCRRRAGLVGGNVLPPLLVGILSDHHGRLVPGLLLGEPGPELPVPPGAADLTVDRRPGREGGGTAWRDPRGGRDVRPDRLEMADVLGVQAVVLAAAAASCSGRALRHGAPAVKRRCSIPCAAESIWSVNGRPMTDAGTGVWVRGAGMMLVGL